MRLKAHCCNAVAGWLFAFYVLLYFCQKIMNRGFCHSSGKSSTVGPNEYEKSHNLTNKEINN